MKLSFHLLPLKCQFFIIFIYIRQWWNFAIESDQKTFFVRLEWLLTFITSYLILILPIPNDVVSSKTWWINRTIHPIKKEEKKKQSTKPLVAHGWRAWTDSVTMTQDRLFKNKRFLSVKTLIIILTVFIYDKKCCCSTENSISTKNV